jgi:hypothetical protein
MVVRLDDISVGDEDVDAAFRAWRRAIEGAHNGSVRGHAAFTSSVDGWALLIKGVPGGKVAKTGSGGIPAMSGTTPGVGDITLYTLGSTLTVGEPDLAYNIAPQAVTGNAWIAVMWVDTEWLCIYEICPA